MRLAILTAAMILSLPMAAALAEGDIEAGKNVFKKCAACHAVGEGAKNRVGPVLNNLFGRVAGTFPDFKYSQAMIDAGAAGLTWDAATLPAFLHKPKDAVPGTKMSFGGLAEQADVDNILAYLLSLSPDYVAPAAALAQ
jgi:cytochrome c2